MKKQRIKIEKEKAKVYIEKWFVGIFEFLNDFEDQRLKSNKIHKQSIKFRYFLT